MKKTLKVFNTLIVIFLSLLFAFFILSGYNGTIDCLRNIIGNTSLFKTVESIVRELHPPLFKSYIFLLLEILFLIILFGVILYKFDRAYYYFKQLIVAIKDFTKASYRDLRYSGLKYILVLPLGISCYYLFTQPVLYDEASAYFGCIKPVFYKCLICYPIPNNHILYSFLASIINILPGDILLKMRITSYLAFVLSILISFQFAKKVFSEKLSILVTGIFSVLFLTLFYSFIGRGYSLLVLFTILSLYSAFCIIKENNRTKHWAFFVISSVLGFYTIPSFLYPFISINLYILLYNYKNILKQIIYNLIIVFLTLILYIPIFIVSGMEMVTSNPLVPNISRSMVVEMMPTLIMWVYGDNIGINAHYVLIFFMLVGLVALVRIKKDFKLVLLWFIFCILPFILTYIQAVFAFSRTFIYLGFILTILTTATFSIYLERIKYSTIIPIALLIQIGFGLNFIDKVSGYSRFLYEYHEFTDLLIDDGMSYYLWTDDDINPNFLFEIERLNYNSSVRRHYTNRNFISADSINNYNYILIDKSLDSTIYKKPKYELRNCRDGLINVYENRDSPPEKVKNYN
ncbi:glycosyltransferase family 39 protein [Dysgonomonas sp. Marseille-P4677]|uniref:glycosyltransferase family 39 protein n=1 Tax=Dysgonomonas sp. Marseille-P4677 TaxID=2364790 RepID=UPI0019125EB6|nr:glycosyltransferase family 39 protein [Dysgonomonas sp. Marseille-P4677]MBK5720701.1 glycosyltransferase family 39 protein [Dysgonomonas sp. Marseille-P4677]